MKYFSPDLLQRIRSLDDEVSVAAHHDWDRAIDSYQRRWRKIKPHFPEGVQRFDESRLCLHDAKVLSMGRQAETFIMHLEQEPPSREIVLLTITLDGEPVIDPKSLPGGPDADSVTWMYEEFDRDRHGQCWFEVLLSNGWSVKLPVRDFRFLVAQRVFPVLDDPTAGKGEQAVPRSA